MISRRGKRTFRDKSDLKFPAKSLSVLFFFLRITTIFFRIRKTNSALCKLKKKNINTVNESVSVSCQTDIDQLAMEELVKNVAISKIENKRFFKTKTTTTTEAGMKRKLIMDNVLYNDESMKFYTGLPTLTCLMAIFNILKPLADKLKYWDNNKGSRVNFQKKPSVKKIGKKRRLTTFQEFILTLVILRQGLLVQHLSDVIAISKYSVSKV